MALGNSPIAVFEQDLDLRYTWIYNPKLGYRADEVIGRTDAEIMDPAVVARIEKPKRQAIATGQPARAEVAAAAPGGAVEYYDLYVEPLRNAASDIVGVICAATDITAQKSNETSLRMTRQRAQLASETAGIGVWEWNITENIIVWDPQMFRIYGIPETEGGVAPYDMWRNSLLPEEAQEQEEQLRRHAREGGVNRREFRIRRHDDGEIRVIQAVETHRFNAEGKTEWVVGTNIDVTEQRRAEEALRASEERLRNAVADAAIGFAIDTPAGAFIDVNRAFCRLTGYEVEELRRMTFGDLVHPDDAVSNRAAAETMLSGGVRGYVIENRYRRQGRTRRVGAQKPFDHP